jgi:TaqI-like C-terminal specificity domain
VFELSFGLKTGDDVRFLASNALSDDHKPLLRGANIHRYSVDFAGEYVWYVPKQMVEHRRTARPGSAARFEQPKVLIRDTGGGLFGTYDDENYYVKDVIIISDSNRCSAALKYLIGILNSCLMRFYYETSFPTLHVQRDELASLPIRTIDFSDPTDKARHDRMVVLVERMLALHKLAATARTDQEKVVMQNQIELTDRLIDRLVYELYGLNEEEIAIVEGAH